MLSINSVKLIMVYQIDIVCINLIQKSDCANFYISDNQSDSFVALYWLFDRLSVNAWKYKFSLLVAQLNKHKESPFQGSFSLYPVHVTKQLTI